MLLLFVPFRNEHELIGKNQTAEEAFNNYISYNNEMGENHKKLSKMLQAQKNVNKINEHRTSMEEEC